MKICIVTGGSGGHIFPAITYADYATKQDDVEVVFIGNDHKMESTIVPKAGYDFYPIHNKGLQGSKVDKVKALFSQFKAIRQAKKHLKDLKPDVVFAFGGYVSVPVGIAANSLGIPLVLHEQNAYPGKANKLLAKRSKAIVTCYKEAFSEMSNSFYLGNPRASLIDETIDSSAEFERLNLKNDMKTVLIVMGSQGSSAMNPIFFEMLKSLNQLDYQLILATGPLHIESFEANFKNLPDNVKITGFVDQKALLPKLDLTVARAGASTIAEIQSFGVPSILIPSPHVANNHQFFNAKSLSDVDACVLLEEQGLTGEGLLTKINEVLHDEVLTNALSANAKHMAKPEAVSDIHQLIETVVK
ncbi:undecaprenyldiphospho-muramoylpentapeptide beta-N-acetylglucosaminyltransferase [Erysipelothrix urinaevulpis]|uniref:undecaprenyldiphospho-muramoylpentapeptide beta-N-acetylglucosaminyltransferase n=1 Tax=Erysipelothrix urinaevulpis TaxID=2683717 RepID=UPI00135ADBA3|nr:undecaprenyldiphospho-muramoylpentapeptide beta-N-acetylglucosaminyltransferase [Erysipelothrix urinaevulpis]